MSIKASQQSTSKTLRAVTAGSVSRRTALGGPWPMGAEVWPPPFVVGAPCWAGSVGPGLRMRSGRDHLHDPTPRPGEALSSAVCAAMRAPTELLMMAPKAKARM